MRNPFAPAPEIQRLPEDETRPVYSYWRVRQLYSVFLGYAFFYLVRKNIPLALPAMEKELGYDKEQLGKILTSGEIVYGISKFINGVAADRSNARHFMAFGLLISGLANLAFGWSGTLLTLSLWWMLSNWFQGMGFPPCARVLSHWFCVRERGFNWSIWATSQQIGAGCAFILSGYLAQAYGWQAVFVVPGLITLVGSLVVFNRLRDTPGSLGLPPAEEYWGEASINSGDAIGAPQEKAPAPAPADEPSYASFLMTRVFNNPYIWIISLANFFIYVLRGSFNNWAPTYLSEVKHLPLTQTGYISALFEGAGVAGSLAAGWVSDRYLGGRRAPVCVVYMLFAAVAVFFFSHVPEQDPTMSALTIVLVGFAVYGPQFMVAVMTADLAGKEAAATAVGLTGIFGYASSVLTGWGTGRVVKNYGWGPTFDMMIGCSILAAILFGLCWKSKPREG